jgi:hypothetical protein
MNLESNRAVVAVVLFASILVASLAISSGSLWIDEFGTWRLTRADSIFDWWRGLESSPSSDSQIPLYHFYMYGWTKFVGTDAFAMRASNMGMFGIANLALVWPFRSRPTVAILVAVTSCLNASVWYYLNEIRPYIMLYMGTCLMIGASIEAMRSKQRPSSFAITALCIGAIIASGATVIGIAWAASTFLFILLYWAAIRKRPLSELANNNYLALAITLLCIIALIAHDIRMFALGKLPALLGKDNLLALLFSFYANIGLLGLGPGMLDIRANGVGELVPFATIVTLSALMFGLVAIGGLIEIRAKVGAGTLGLLIFCIILPVLFIFLLSVVVHWRALPRHFIPLISVFSILYAFGLAWWWQRRVVGMAVALISTVLMGYSALNVRYAPRHAKDDYKHAADLAEIELARGGRVWWVAEGLGALYYGLPVRDYSGPAGATDTPAVQIIFSADSAVKLSTQPPPTVVLLSKPGTYDRQNAVIDYLSANKYQLFESFPAFTAWRQQDPVLLEPSGREIEPASETHEAQADHDLSLSPASRAQAYGAGSR